MYQLMCEPVGENQTPAFGIIERMAIGCIRTVVGVCVVAALSGALFAAEPPHRARPPVWSRDVLDAFFDDARQKLEGERPDYATLAKPNSPTGEPASAGGNTTSEPQFAWSKLIDADVIETEVKRINQSLSEIITTPSAFKGGGYKLARREFSELALLFAVTGQYDGPARWQDSAAGLRDLFARAGYNAKVGTDQTYNEAQLRRQELADLVRGSRPTVPKTEAAVDWSRVADRPPLMQRLNIAHEERLTKWLADAASFRRHRDDVKHEAQIVAMLADVIAREGFDYWDEEEYATHARELEEAATAVAMATDQDSFHAARQAIGRATNACARCHEDYRG
jgi:hypothetical protein